MIILGHIFIPMSGIPSALGNSDLIGLEGSLWLSLQEEIHGWKLERDREVVLTERDRKPIGKTFGIVYRLEDHRAE